MSRRAASVALASYNGERYIGAQLDSIAAQTRLPDEIIVSDDASADGTVAAVERFARSAPCEVRIMRNRDRVGHADNFFRAMLACRGEFTAVCDQDDVWRPDKLERCLTELARAPETQLVLHSARLVDSDLRPLDAEWPSFPTRQTFDGTCLAPFAFVFPGCVMTYRSAILHGVDPAQRPRWHDRGTATLLGHDGWLTLMCGATGSIVALPDALSDYRRHSEAVTAEGRLRTRLQTLRWLAGSALATRDEAHRYRWRSANGNEFGAYLQLRAARGDLHAEAVAQCQAVAQVYLTYGDVMARRAGAYEQRSRPARAAVLARNISRGDYGDPVTGRLGRGALARDATLGLARPASGRSR
jgi:glycosyltransferase involved in cell wall biosynthesis